VAEAWVAPVTHAAPAEPWTVRGDRSAKNRSPLRLYYTTGAGMWSVAQVLPNQVDRASANLQRQGYRYFNPVYETKKLRRKKLVVRI
jgi:hypothetical protein